VVAGHAYLVINVVVVGKRQLAGHFLSSFCFAAYYLDGGAVEVDFDVLGVTHDLLVLLFVLLDLQVELFPQFIHFLLILQRVNAPGRSTFSGLR
jgi:hypothetical protein